MIRHLREEHSMIIVDTPLWCDICKMRITEYRVTLHQCLKRLPLVIGLTAKLPYACPVCPRSFTSKIGKRNHMMSVHRNTNRIDSTRVTSPTIPPSNADIHDSLPAATSAQDAPDVIASDTNVSPTISNSPSGVAHIAQDDGNRFKLRSRTYCWTSH